MAYVDNYIATFNHRSCGQNLKYCPDFIVLDQTAKVGEPVQYGNHICESEPINWMLVEQLCKGVCELNLALRVVVWQH